MSRPPYQQRQLIKFRKSLTANPTLTICGRTVVLKSILGPGRITVPWQGLLVAPFNESSSADIKKDADDRGIRNISYLYAPENRGAYGSYKLKLEFKVERGIRLISTIRDYIHFLGQIANPNANKLIASELMPHRLFHAVRNSKSSRQEQLHQFYVNLSPNHSMSPYNFWNKIRFQETHLRETQVLSAEEKLPTKKTVYVWVKQWQREFRSPESITFEHEDLVKGSRSVLYE